MASLRARLLTGLLVVAAIGLLVLGAVTYADQRSFHFSRVDQHARSALPLLSRALDIKLGAAGGRDGPAGFDEHRKGDGGPERGHYGPGGFNPPAGTYGERRSPTGQVLGHVYAYGAATRAAPRLPKNVPFDHAITVSSTTGSGPRYRAIATSDREGVTIAAVPLHEADQTLSSLLRVEALVIGGVLAVLTIVALFVVRLGLRPLDRMATVAGEIAAGKLSHRVSPATPKTEVGRLGVALNGMLERLERAFAEREASEQRLRQFLADASHELRTPLTSIRGYAELFRMGAAEDPVAVDTAMKRIEDEAKRMGILVEDLLALARLDELREPVRESVDVRELVLDAVDDARATAPDRRITLFSADPAITSGDPQQLRQVLGNLMRNALIHTPPGTPVEVRMDGDQKAISVEVRDHGPGLPSGDTSRLFQRFWRAEGGRARGKGGAGLGLAIVGEIVDAHGGSVEAGAADGGGARFVVRLPRVT